MFTLFRQHFIGAKAAIATRKTRNVCPKCATLKKSGKRSCCAPGGAWFNKCGNAGSRDVNYSWVEGMQACKGYAVSFSGKTQSQFMLDRETMQARSNTTHERNVTRQTAVNSGGGGNGESETGAIDCECLDELAKMISWISFSFMILTVR